MRAAIHWLLTRLGPPSEGDPGDDELLSAFLGAGDEVAFAAIVRRHGPMVHGVCRRVLRNDADADDAFQATFLVLVRKADAVRPRSMLGNWLYGVAWNVARRGRDLVARRRGHELAAGLLAGPGREAGGVAEHAELRSVLDRELSRLPDAYRAAVVACDLEGQTRKEAAGRLGWSEGTLASRLARGRALLADRLRRRGVVVPAAGVAATLGLPAAAAAAIPREPGVFTAGFRAGPVVEELANEVVRAMTTSKLQLAAVWAVAVVGIAGVATAAALASGLHPADPVSRAGQVVTQSAAPVPPAGLKPTHFVLTNPAKDITVVSDRQEKLVEFFKRQKLMVAGVRRTDAEALLTAKEPTDRTFLSLPSYNVSRDGGGAVTAYAAVVNVAPPAKPVAELLEPLVAAARNDETVPIRLVFRQDEKEPEVWHPVGFTTRKEIVFFFLSKEKKEPDDFAPADLIRPADDKK
jgi:RNA polymerase sigma factor (sigma-70 family)